jgi:hypothetical protein
VKTTLILAERVRVLTPLVPDKRGVVLVPLTGIVKGVVTDGSEIGDHRRFVMHVHLLPKTRTGRTEGSTRVHLVLWRAWMHPLNGVNEP